MIFTHNTSTQCYIKISLLNNKVYIGNGFTFFLSDIPYKNS